MGLANKTTLTRGVLGIGYAGAEASNTLDGKGFTYPNLVQAMVNDSIIKSPAYSLWLNDIRTSPDSYLS